jgi:hypothetical protein
MNGYKRGLLLRQIKSITVSSRSVLSTAISMRLERVYIGKLQ